MIDEVSRVTDREKKKIVRAVSSSQLGREVPEMKEISRNEFRVQRDRILLILKWVDYVCDWTGTDESVLQTAIVDDLLNQFEEEGYQAFLDGLDVLSRMVIGSPDPELRDPQSVTEDMYPHLYEERKKDREMKKKIKEDLETSETEKVESESLKSIREDERDVLDGLMKEMEEKKKDAVKIQYESQLGDRVFTRTFKRGQIQDPDKFHDWESYQSMQMKESRSLSNRVLQGVKVMIVKSVKGGK